MTRDSIVLWLGILGGLVIYLAGTKPVTEWGYYEWLAFAGYAISVISAKLGGSILAGSATAPERVVTALGGLLKLTKPEDSQ